MRKATTRYAARKPRPPQHSPQRAKVRRRTRLPSHASDLQLAFSTIIHDLRSPLTVLKSITELLEKSPMRYWDGHEGKYFEQIRASVYRMDKMVKELADEVNAISAQPEINVREVDLPRLMSDLRYELMRSIETERVRIETEKNLPKACCDPDQVHRILTNLLSNALEYSDPGSEVLVKFMHKNKNIVVSVVDHGAGIEPFEIPKLFQPYYRISRLGVKRDGLGLGLYVVKKLVEAQRGRIWVESEPKKGSTFSFTLPAA